VRVIAATNRDLEAAYRAGTFRKDLYFRLNVVTVHIAPLRERRNDIQELVQWFLSRYAPTQPIKITPAAMHCLRSYDWPGNVRELENCMERAVALGDQQLIDVADLPPGIRSNANGFAPSNGRIITEPVFPASSTDLEDLERVTIQRVFEKVNGDKTLAGQLLGISRATLYRKLKRYGIGMKAAAGAGSN